MVQAGVEVLHQTEEGVVLDPDGAVSLLPYLEQTVALGTGEMHHLLQQACSEVYQTSGKFRWQRTVDYTENEDEDEDELLIDLESCKEGLEPATVASLDALPVGRHLVFVLSGAAPMCKSNSSHTGKARMSKAARKRLKKNSLPAGGANVKAVAKGGNLEEEPGAHTGLLGVHPLLKGGSSIVIRKQDSETIGFITQLDRLCSLFEAIETLF